MSLHPSTEPLRGTLLARPVRERLIARTNAYAARGVVPTLAVVAVPDHPAVASYVQMKARTAAALGVALRVEALDADSGPADLVAVLERLEDDPGVHGVMLGLPLSPRIDPRWALAQIPADKDVDGLTPTNIGLTTMGDEDNGIVAATPRACVMLAETMGELDGKHVVVVGQGLTVGRVLADALTNRHATVTTCHHRTRDLAAVTREAEILFTATGVPGLIGAAHVHAGQVVIDAGIAERDGAIVGDVDQAAVAPLVRALTPVPGGVGPLTSVLIFDNLLRLVARRVG